MIRRQDFPTPARIAAVGLLAGSLLLGSLSMAQAFTQNPATVFINEIHYDNTGTDAGEAVEIAGPAGTDLSGWSIVLYNGSGGAVYTTTALGGTIPDQQNGFGTVAVSYPSNGIQNGSPDGIALVSPGGTVVQFLSYEGSFAATDGPASGLTSTDIGVLETGSEPLGLSLQLTGSGTVYQDFAWAAPADDSFGQINGSQGFGGGPLPTLSVAVSPASFSEAAGAAAATGTVTRTGSAAAAVSVNLSSSDASEAVVPATVTLAAGASSATFAVDAVDDAISDGSQAVTITAAAPGFATGTTGLTVTDDEPVSVTLIREIQGKAQISPKNGQFVSNVPGIVTAKRSNGFYLQDPAPDGDEGTSEAIFVFTSSAPTVAVGDSLAVSGTVTEFIPGGASTGNLSITEITSPAITVVSSGNPLPAPTVIGVGGRVPPTQVIDDDGLTSFDPTTDGIDFYESLEAMRVQVNAAVATSPTLTFNEGESDENSELIVLADGGAGAALRTDRGGIVIRADDFNPERLFIGDAIARPGQTLPKVNVGDSFSGPVTGVLDYSFGNFKLLITETLPGTASAALKPEQTTLAAGGSQLTIASFNVENLDPGDTERIAGLAAALTDNLKAPDILVLQEVQDNNGPTDDGTVDSTTTLADLAAAIAGVGGPAYDFRFINPVNNQDGGEPGGNIRVAFLFNPARVSFIDRPAPAGTDLSTTAVGAVSGPSGLELTFSPGRIDPANPAFDDSRKPLVGEFFFNGRKLFVVGNHFNSKGGDTPLFGAAQPPVLNSEPQRLGQATAVNGFVQSLLAIDPKASVIVLGDLNDFQFSPPLATLQQGGLLTNLIDRVSPSDAYTFNFQGNSQVLDHILLGGSLAAAPAEIDIVHLDTEFTDALSDHDPPLARLDLTLAPLTATGISPTSGPVGSQITITGTGFVSDGTTVRFRGGVEASAVAVNGDGTQLTVTVPAGARSGRLAVRTSGRAVLTPNRFVVTP
ncbi:endonuclease/exonuclease/phosphatase family protein [Gloeobacter morelensis]|uniref:Endonuclease/exonuclease/phosphatase family protein n=1 Tax=Gloeobacter morelensis MG652769 TaxID=2781736 RepID=A0ABY3PMR0_9CYAN|nr:endonuclease/exonuclease/phosphatase family protein [Gloeobacter morelensis]UFP94978.1 endonuclease/exonuclease/phosphatase family protein [Gloeobacter morelensis MG652769]